MPKQILPFLPALAFLLTAAWASAAPPDPQPGTYVYQRGGGSLQIRNAGDKGLVFEIETTGANCHACQVSGVIRNGTGKTGGDDEQCAVSFKSAGASVDVKPVTEEACRSYCGTRAHFEGIYRIPPQACTTAGRKAQRENALRLYRDHKYKEAAQILKTVATQCADYSDWIEVDQIRNDLALAQYHDGNAAQCLATLNETIAGKVKNEAELKGEGNVINLPPCDFDNYIQTAKATWFNQAICTKALAKRR